MVSLSLGCHDFLSVLPILFLFYFFLFFIFFISGGYGDGFAGFFRRTYCMGL